MDNELLEGEWFNSRDLKKPPQRLIPKIDDAVSAIVGMPVVVNDPRLIKLVVKWKQEAGSSTESDKMDNFLRDEKKRTELYKTFRG